MIGQLAGENLEREGDSAINNRRNRNHEKQQEQRKRQFLQHQIAAQQPNYANQADDKGHAGREQLGAQGSQHELQGAGHYHQQAPGVGVRLQRQQFFTTLPDDETGDDRHEETVTHIRVVVPLADQAAQNGRVATDQQHAEPGNRDPRQPGLARSYGQRHILEKQGTPVSYQPRYSECRVAVVPFARAQAEAGVVRKACNRSTTDAPDSRSSQHRTFTAPRTASRTRRKPLTGRSLKPAARCA